MDNHAIDIAFAPAKPATIKHYFVTVTYYGEPPDTIEYDDPTEAREGYWATVDQRDDLGMAFGDCSSIIYGAILSDGRRVVFFRNNYS